MDDPADVISAKFAELDARPDVVGVTLRDLDRALVDDGHVYDPTVIHDAIAASVDEVICSVKDKEGRSIKRDGLNVWTFREDAA